MSVFHCKATVNSDQQELDQALSTLETQVDGMFEQHKVRLGRCYAWNGLLYFLISHL